MGWPQPQPESVARILAWLREQDPRLALDALVRPLRDAGYAEPDIRAAIATRQAELDAALPAGSDLRSRATTILLVGFFATFGIIALGLLTGESMAYGAGGIAAVILGALLLPGLLVGLVAIRRSGRLRRGAAGAMAVILALPFIYLVVIAGTCVLSTRPFG